MIWEYRDHDVVLEGEIELSSGGEWELSSNIGRTIRFWKIFPPNFVSFTWVFFKWEP